MATPLTLDGAAPLSHWGLIRARGADAVKFLQGQLTNDVATLDSSQARLAGFCSAKGRLQASFVMWKPAHDEVLLACAASVLAATLERLSMFVLRSQCKLSDAGTEFTMTGVVGDSAHALIGDMPVWAVRTALTGTLLRLPDAAGLARCIVIAAAPDAAPVQAPALPLDLWRWLEVQSGIPTIEAATAEQFVPQMLNYELVGGVDFQKGCYPGQEVVARSQYRGTIKRRMHLFDCDAHARAGQEVFHSADANQPAGMVVNAAPRPDGTGSSALVEVKLGALADGTLHLGAVDGAVLGLRALPYPLPSQEPPVAPAA
jgi:tRNA-modifying protein YgfZ